MPGTSGRTRTGTLLRAGDFESPMSTNSITLAFNLYCWQLRWQGRDYSSDQWRVNRSYGVLRLNGLAFRLNFYTLAPKVQQTG